MEKTLKITFFTEELDKKYITEKNPVQDSLKCTNNLHPVLEDRNEIDL